MQRTQATVVDVTPTEYLVAACDPGNEPELLPALEVYVVNKDDPSDIRLPTPAEWSAHWFAVAKAIQSLLEQAAG
jgi:hypothetical protein